jgi:hypothetical protein
MNCLSLRKKGALLVFEQGRWRLSRSAGSNQSQSVFPFAAYHEAGILIAAGRAPLPTELRFQIRTPILERGPVHPLPLFMLQLGCMRDRLIFKQDLLFVNQELDTPISRRRILHSIRKW